MVGFLCPELEVAPYAPEAAVLELGFELPLVPVVVDPAVELLPVFVLLLVGFIINIIQIINIIN